MNKLVKRVTEDMEKYRFSDAALSVYEFFWHTFCDWYIEISKIELAAENSAYKNTVQNVLLTVLKNTLILMHPIMPFITEEIYQSINFKGKKQSIMIETWPEYSLDFEFDQLGEMDDLQKYIYTIRNLRGEYEISPGEKTDVYIGQVKKDNIHRKYEAIIKQLAKTEKMLDNYEPENFILANVTDAKGALIAVAGINKNVLKNVDAIIKNKEKRITELEKAITGIKIKLNNPKFLEHAAKKLIEEETIKMDTYTEETGKIKKQIESLGGRNA